MNMVCLSKQIFDKLHVLEVFSINLRGLVILNQVYFDLTLLVAIKTFGSAIRLRTKYPSNIGIN